MNLTQLTSQLKINTDFNANSAFGLSDINGVTGIVDNSVSSLQALIFSNRNPENDDRSPSRFDVTGITSGYDKTCFVFDLKKDYKLNLSSEITDHYVESNVAIQDHIGLKPIIIEVTGCISEVNLKDKLKEQSDLDRYLGQKSDGNIFNSVDSYLGRMGSLTSFAPNIVNQAMNIYNTAKYVYATTNKVINLDKKDTLGNTRFAYNSEYDEEIIKETKQFEWIDWFKTQWWKRASFSIVTPYGVFDNMYIMDLSAVQPENTRYVTNLNIKFKQIRRAVVIRQQKQMSRTRQTQVGKITEAKEVKIPTKEALAGVQNQGVTNIGIDTKNDINTLNYSNSTIVANYNVSSGEGQITTEAIDINLSSFQGGENATNNNN